MKEKYTEEVELKIITLNQKIDQLRHNRDIASKLEFNVEMESIAKRLNYLIFFRNWAKDLLAMINKKTSK